MFEGLLLGIIMTAFCYMIYPLIRLLMGVYAKKNLMNTYVPLGFPANSIKSIITGSKYEVNGFSVEEVMEVLGYHDVKILHSTSGYR